MRDLSLTRRATAVTVATAVALFLDLLLPWQRAAVQVAGVVDVHSTTSGILTGWGTLAAVFALVIAGLGVRRLRNGSRGRSLGMVVLALGMLVMTGLAVFVGRADVDVAQPALSTTVDATLWAAWTGFGLAVISAAASLVPFVPEARHHARGAAPPRAAA